MAGQALAKQGASTDADGEHGDQRHQHSLIAAKRKTRVVRQLGDIHRADEPKPGDTEDRQKYRTAGACELDDAPGFGNGIPVNTKRAVDSGHRRYASARQVTHHRNHDDVGSDQRDTGIAEADQMGACHGAQEDGQEGPRFHQSVSADELLILQHLRNDAVFHWCKQRRLRAHQKKQADQQRHVFEIETDGGTDHDNDLKQLN